MFIIPFKHSVCHFGALNISTEVAWSLDDDYLDLGNIPSIKIGLLEFFFKI